MKQPKLLIKPKNKDDKDKAKVMQEVVNYMFEDMIKHLDTPFRRAVQAEHMSLLLYGYIDPEYVKQKQDEFLKLYEEYLNIKGKHDPIRQTLH